MKKDPTNQDNEEFIRLKRRFEAVKMELEDLGSGMN